MSIASKFWHRLNPLLQLAAIGVVAFVVFRLLPTTWTGTLDIVFSSREEALMLWTVILLLWGFSQRGIREGISRVLKALFQKRIITLLFVILLYVSALIGIFAAIGLWQFALMKEAVFWFFGTAFISFINLNEVGKDRRYFRKAILETLTLFVFIEFVLEFYTFDFATEFICVTPITFLLGMGFAYAAATSELRVKTLIGVCLTVTTLGLLARALLHLFRDYEGFFTLNNMRALFLPLALTIVYLPFLFLLALATTYKDFFDYIDWKIGKRDNELARFLKFRTLSLCRANLWRLKQFQAESTRKIWTLKDKDDVNSLICNFKRDHS